MKLFKSESGEVFQFSDEQISQGLGVGMKLLTDSQIQAHINPPATQEQINAAARDYLSRTDWYVIRFHETGEAIPVEVLSARKESREKVVE